MRTAGAATCLACAAFAALTIAASRVHAEQCDVYILEYPKIPARYKGPGPDGRRVVKRDGFIDFAKERLARESETSSALRYYQMTETKRGIKHLGEALNEAAGSDCECISKFVLIAHGNEGALSIGCGATEHCTAPYVMVLKTQNVWEPFFRDELRPKLCKPSQPDQGIYLYGCGVGVCDNGAKLVAEVARLTGTNVFAPTDGEVPGYRILEHISKGPFQVARPSNQPGTPPAVPPHRSATKSPARMREYGAGPQYYCPCNQNAYSTTSSCSQNCQVTLGCFTNICEEFTVNDRWLSHSSGPVLMAGPTGAWDESGVSSPTVLRASPYSMWFSGWDRDSEYPTSIGYATSPYALKWTKHPQNPVLTSGPIGSWEDDGVYAPTILKDEGIYKMWYVGYSASEALPRIGYATSPDGVLWKKHPENPVLDVGGDDAWDFNGVSDPSVIKSGDAYMMWYAGHDGAVWRIGHATSTDGITWSKDSQNPVLSTDEDSDIWSVNGPSVVEDAGTYHMLYVTTKYSDEDVIRYASSRDPARWVHTTDAPHFSRQPGEDFQSEDVSHPSLLVDHNESVFKAFYRGGGESSWSIGFGVATDLPTGTE